jgi:hypothetical protein
VWVRDILLTDAQRQIISSKASAKRAAISGMNLSHLEARKTAQKQGREQAEKQDPLHAMGCMLYWAEGNKGRNEVRMSNSDPHVLMLFMRFLRQYFQLSDEKFSISCNFYECNGLDTKTIEEFWLNSLQLPRSCIRKHTIKTFQPKQKLRDSTLYGVCSVSVCRTDVLQHIYGAIQEYGGFERKAWLKYD